MFTEFDAADGLHVGVREPEGGGAAASDVPTVLAIHGITSSHKAWQPLARALPQARVIAPDLRGRGGSRDLPGPWGMARHADDLADVLADMGVGPVLPVGHSMGGYVALTLAHRHPGLVAGRVVLVDGGLPLKGDPALAPEESLRRTLGPAAQRPAMTFASLEEYRAFWARHPAFARWSEDIESSIAYDLVAGADGLRPATSYEAMAADSRDLVTPGNDAARALRALEVPIDFLRAARGMLDEEGGLFPSDWVAERVARLPRVRVHEVPDVNHYTITLSDAGARAIAAVVRSGTSTG